MKAVIVLCLLFSLSQAWWWSSDTDCGMDRDKALECIQRAADTNHDGKVSLKELTDCKNRYLTKAEKLALSIGGLFSSKVTVEHTMEVCDANKDGLLTPEDWVATKDHCLPHASDLCKLKKYLCDRIP